MSATALGWDEEVMSMMWGGDWGWGAVMMISFWVLLAVLVWGLVRIASRPERHESPRGKP
jgi:uncharacterized membrane protein